MTISYSLRINLPLRAILAFALAWSQSASAQSSRQVYNFIGAGQDYNYLGFGSSSFDLTGAPHTDSGTHSWTGLDSQGNIQTMTMSGTVFGSVLEFAFKGTELMEMEARSAALEASVNVEGGKA